MDETKARNRAYGKMVKIKLVEIDMNQKELAERLGIDPKRMSDIIRGTRPLLKYRETINQILGLVESEISI